jgi:Tfp pilus assembly protein PilO
MTRKLRFILSIAALVVVVAMAWFFLISPLRAEITETDNAITAEQTKLAAAQAKLAQAEITRAEGKKNQARLIELAKMVPASSQVPSLLVQIQDLADQSGIDFISVNPGDPQEADGFQIVPLTLEFSGSYFDLSDFAYRAEQLVAAPGRLLTVKNVQLQLGGEASESSETSTKVQDSPNLNVSMTLYAFCMDQAAAKRAPVDSGTPSSPGASTDKTTPPAEQ